MYVRLTARPRPAHSQPAQGSFGDSAEPRSFVGPARATGVPHGPVNHGHPRHIPSPSTSTSCARPRVRRSLPSWGGRLAARGLTLGLSRPGTAPFVQVADGARSEVRTVDDRHRTPMPTA